MGRKPTCECGACEKCQHRVRVRKAYQALSPEGRLELVARRDPEKTRAADRARYYRDKEKRRAAMDAYGKANPEKLNANKKAWIDRNPDKRRAHNSVANAVRAGKLVKQPCEVCGAENVHAHHDDYAKPLEVRWLCPAHHAEERRK